jgi:Glycosyl hydrolases family 16
MPPFAARRTLVVVLAMVIVPLLHTGSSLARGGKRHTATKVACHPNTGRRHLASRSRTVRPTSCTTACSAAYRSRRTTSKPTAPSSLAASAGNGAVPLSWGASTDRVDAVAGYRVFRNTVQVAQVTSTSYKDSWLTDGTTYSYYAVAYDTAGNVSSASNTVSATPISGPPVNTALPAISGQPTQSRTLTASTGTWGGSPSSYTYQWQHCASAGCTNISGATGSSYALQSSDVGDTIDLVVTAANGNGSASATSAQTAAVAASSSQMPVGVPGNWKLSFDDEFPGSSLNTSNWVALDGWSMNNVTAHARNVSVSGGNLALTLASSSSGAFVSSSPSDGAGVGYMFPVGSYIEARIMFPGSGTTVHNWPAFWTSGPNWPAAGEIDIAEGLGTLTVNYHSPSGAHNFGTIPGNWAGAFHTYGIYRAADHCDVYYDGQLVKTFPTDDNGQPQSVLINVGSGNTAVYGSGSQVLVDYVRAWS